MLYLVLNKFDYDVDCVVINVIFWKIAFMVLRFFFFFSSRRRHTRSVSAFLLNRSSDLCVTIDVLPRTPGNNVYVGFMVWSNFTATKCRGLVSLNQVIKEIICLQPLK